MSYYELQKGVFANQKQREAIDILTSFYGSKKKSFTLCGKAGTGKTTVIKNFIKNNNITNFIGIAISHQAKRVLGDQIGQDNVLTVSSALAIKLNEETGEFEPDKIVRLKNKIPIKKYKLIICDECSMISQEILDEIYNCMSGNAKVIFMGDHHQLPPIGNNSNISPTFLIKDKIELIERMRQGEDSPIVYISDIIADNIDSDDIKIRKIGFKDRYSVFNKKTNKGVLFINNIDTAIDMFCKDFLNSENNPYFVKMITYNNHLHNNHESVKNLNKKIREKIFNNLLKIELFNKNELVIAYSAYDPNGLDNLHGEEPLIKNSENYIIKNINKTTKNISFDVKSNTKGVRFFSKEYNILELTLIDLEGNQLENIPVIDIDSLGEYNNDLKFYWENDKQIGFQLKSHFADLQYGYASTSHRSQGSTYINTYVCEDNILNTNNPTSNEVKNKSLYTAITRPSHKLVMISETNNNVELDIPYLQTPEYIEKNSIKFIHKTSKTIEGYYEEFSNFYELDQPILDKFGLEYKTVEHFYQAKKSNDINICKLFSNKGNFSAAKAKKEGQLIDKISNWEQLKFYVMYEGIKQKFTKNNKLKELLISTGEQQIIEWCYWDDMVWGCSSNTGHGNNALGKLLQILRDKLK